MARPLNMGQSLSPASSQAILVWRRCLRLAHPAREERVPGEDHPRCECRDVQRFVDTGPDTEDYEDQAASDDDVQRQP